MTALSFDSCRSGYRPRPVHPVGSAGNAINDSGVVVGQAGLYNDSTQYAFVYTPQSGQATLIPSPAGSANRRDVVAANAVNSAGNCVGTLAPSATGVEAAYYFNGSNVVQIHTPADTGSTFYFADANGINAANQVVGAAVMSASTPTWTTHTASTSPPAARWLTWERSGET